MAGGEFVGSADVEHESGAAGIALPRLERWAVDTLDTEAGGDGLGTLPRGSEGFGARRCEAGGRTIFEV